MKRFSAALLFMLSLTFAGPASGRALHGQYATEAGRPGIGGIHAGNQADSTAGDGLAKALEAYLKALDRQPAEVKLSETDFIISSCTDPLVRQETARAVYRYFADSKIMGDEAVAIHVYDNWFATGELTFGDDALDWAAKFHASVNRLSLIGNPAPPLCLTDRNGDVITVPEQNDGRFKILFFYDTGCAKCRVESARLRDFLKKCGTPAVLYEIYAGGEREKWMDYISAHPDDDFPSVKTLHLHDPDGDSGMDVRYGIIQTPGMFLVSPGGTILGRKLDTPALEALLAIYAPEEMTYGTDQAMEALRQAFLPIEKGMGCAGVSEMAGRIAASALGRQDTLMFKQLTGDLLYFVSNRREHDFKCGTGQFADKYILSRPDIWNTADDTLKVVSLASLMKSLSDLSPIGSKMPKVKVSATLINKSGERRGTYRLDRQKNSAVIFHTHGCKSCENETAAAKESFMTSGNRKILLVDMDEICSEFPDTAGLLFDSFDLSGLPFILTTDRKGRVADKYVSFIF